MPEDVRLTLIAISIVFIMIGLYYRIRSQSSGEILDRTKEGWPLLISIRVLGLLIWATTAVWLWRPALFARASLAMPMEVQWIGVTCFAGTIVWLVAMFQSLGRNITDTVVTRQDAQFVERGPYRVVRNPMYIGVLMCGVSLGLALGTWLLPVLTGLMFLLFALRTRIEEKYLIQRFGETYLNYMARVGRFFPKLPPRSQS